MDEKEFDEQFDKYYKEAKIEIANKFKEKDEKFLKDNQERCMEEVEKEDFNNTAEAIVKTSSKLIEFQSKMDDLSNTRKMMMMKIAMKKIMVNNLK